MPYVSVTKRILDVLDLTDADPDFNACVSSCNKATDGNAHTTIVIFDLDDLESTILVLS